MRISLPLRMAAALVRKQDMPPPGGYKPIPYLRVPVKTYFSGYTIFAMYIGVTAGSLYLYYLNYKSVTKRTIEMRSAKMAVYPMLLAERDRAYLKQLIANREAETELMKDVPGWEVGTYYGEKIYDDLPPDTLVEPIFQEYYAHASLKDFMKRADLNLWT